MATKAKKVYLVASEDGSWHYAPQEAESPEEAIRLSDCDAETRDQIGTTHLVYELVSKTPHTFNTMVKLVRNV